MTEKNYHQNSYIKEIKAKVLKKEKEGDLWKILPDKTIVYPGGGGQPQDRGFIENFEIVKIKEENGKIFHYIKEDIKKDEISISIDFKKRYDYMQQHTAQHLLSEVLIRLYNYETLSFSIGEEHSSIEINTKHFDFNKIKETEEFCLNQILKSIPVKIYYTNDSSSVPFRKPPKVKDNIRVVEIENFDYSACGGTHLKNTSEISLIKIIKTDKVRSNIRLYYVAGYRALNDYQNKNRIILEAQKILGRPQEELIDGLNEFKDKYERLRKEIKNYKKREIEDEIEKIIKSSEDFIFKVFEDEDIKDLKFMAKKITSSGKNILFVSKNPTKFLIIGRGKGDINLKELSGKIFSIVKGRGGGREDWIEGKLEDLSDVEKLKLFLSEYLDKA